MEDRRRGAQEGWSGVGSLPFGFRSDCLHLFIFSLWRRFARENGVEKLHTRIGREKKNGSIGKR